MPLRRTCLGCGNPTTGSRCSSCQAARDLEKAIPNRLRKLVLTPGARCTYCSALADTIDHLVPLARGGRTVLENLAPACRRDNFAKSDRTEAEYRSLLARR